MTIAKMKRTEDYETGREVFYTYYAEQPHNVAICEGTFGLSEDERNFMQNAHISRSTSKYGYEVTYTA